MANWHRTQRGVLQMLMDHDEKIDQATSDVDVLKLNQMQLANTLQVNTHPHAHTPTILIRSCHNSLGAYACV